MNYLRSMLPDGYFIESPQEFFASISNQWFTDSAKTIELGLLRFDAGHPHPLNQALFFAEVYSQGKDKTFFYSSDTAGNIERFDVPLSRDQYGHINGLTFHHKQYKFKLDEQGNVLAYSVVDIPPLIN